MKRTNQVTCMVVDTGLFAETAITLARSMKKVYYCNPGWVSAAPRQNDAEVGLGMEGIEVVQDVHEHFDEVDLYCFFDIYFGRLQTWLVGQGKAVWGSRMAEELEIDRILCREEMKKVGLPVPPYEVVTGIEALRKYLKTHDDVFVKCNKWRGTMETVHAKTYEYAKPRIDKLEHDLGPFGPSTKFLVDDALPDCVELGTDAWTVDGEFPERHMAGIEIKDLCYVARMIDRERIPEPVRRFEEKMAVTFDRYGYRGLFSTECRIGKDHVPYMIDFCARQGSPPGELEQYMLTNFADICWYGANGIMQEPEEVAEFGAQAVISSPWAERNFQPVTIPDEFRKQVKLRNAVKVGDRYYCLPQDVPAAEIGSIVAAGDTLEEAVDQIREIAEAIEGYQVEVPLHAFDTAHEHIEKAKEFKLDFFTTK